MSESSASFRDGRLCSSKCHWINFHHFIKEVDPRHTAEKALREEARAIGSAARIEKEDTRGEDAVRRQRRDEERNAVVGHRIRVWWDGEKEWFRGRVVSYYGNWGEKTKRERHHVQYDDEEEDWEKLFGRDDVVEWCLDLNPRDRVTAYLDEESKWYGADVINDNSDCTYDLDFDDAGSDESVGQARLKPRAAPQRRFGAEAEVEVEYEGVGNWHAAFVERVVTVHGDDRYDVVINDEGTPHLVRNVHGDRIRPRS